MHGGSWKCGSLVVWKSGSLVLGGSVKSGSLVLLPAVKAFLKAFSPLYEAKNLGCA